ncbi:MAG TPA: right-handed parallel beta-helix repeat-containing protein [Phycisphaerae bacterium]|nr:right-handed parallel beta-helix repeat-containing protein [Phycisphaerae bacterium]HOJ72992.1 right-handed parallel beta-helix repeat-containing protein [Phycisphaerae bacterium]HOM50176.1 right-handed parallel beta-helix repeat-containing protein [Phycisphaerae bacterium]HON67338.1 right-handed parallel beta-helix repeat-containing protein [Phycisphaerae bacterium]HOQ84305.1 right-handed parallel beta-helix repeat-containing protein [Phycisphaerae bacterium]
MAPLERRTLLAGLGLAGSSLLAGAAKAGDLNPPPGPIGPTMKRLDQVEPRTPVQTLSGSANSLYVVQEPGAYYLTADILGQPGMNGLEIACDDVTVDLCGFSIVGGLYSISGIAATYAWRRITIHNGRVIGWRTHGIDLGQSTECIVERVQVAQNGHIGIKVGPAGFVHLCTIRECMEMGINAGLRSQVSHCRTVDCTTGVRAAGGSMIQACVAASSNGIGFELIDTGSCAQDCSSVQCATGFACDANATIRTSAAVNCSVAGFHVRAARNVIRECQAMGGGKGFYVTGTSNLLLRNAASGNGQDYSIAAGNSYGPLVSVAGVGDVSAVAAASHPWANFIY